MFGVRLCNLGLEGFGGKDGRSFGSFQFLNEKFVSFQKKKKKR